MTAPKMKKAFVIRDFKDAGAEERFIAGKTVEIEEGRFRNFAAAGLVRDPADDKAKAPAQ